MSAQLKFECCTDNFDRFNQETKISSDDLDPKPCRNESHIFLIVFHTEPSIFIADLYICRSFTALDPLEELCFTEKRLYRER